VAELDELEPAAGGGGECGWGAHYGHGNSTQQLNNLDWSAAASVSLCAGRSRTGHELEAVSDLRGRGLGPPQLHADTLLNGGSEQMERLAPGMSRTC
jgi:hypothetical protein